MSADNQLEHAAAQLRCAAALAEQRALGNPFDPWSAMAGTIRLIAAGLDPMLTSISIEVAELHEHLASALAALDDVPGDDAPTDFPFWRAHVVDLAANAHALEAPTV